MSGLDLGLVGNCAVSALVDSVGRIVWCCLPRFDGDPVFHALLGAPPQADRHAGAFTVDLDDHMRSEQAYDPNTAILRTRLWSSAGDGIEITDFCPRFASRGRMFRPAQLVRRLRPLTGRPRITVRVRPRFAWGREAPAITMGSNHVRYVGADLVLRLTTNAPVTYLAGEVPFVLDGPMDFLLGPDETVSEGIAPLAREFEEETASHWRGWSRRLAVPLEWQDAVIRAAITLKLCTFEETGAIVAAMTTSIPEAPGTQRTWDYRYCWLRDAFFVVRALNSLAEVETMETYLRYLYNIVRDCDGHVQPVYGIARERHLVETVADSLPGYRGMGPVRVGNQAHEHLQHDVYGNIVLAASQSFFDQRLFRRPTLDDFRDLERIGERAFALHAVPDAGMWELRTRARVHTSSSLMCWAACDRLARIAANFGLADRARYWSAQAATIHKAIIDNAWSPERGSFVESFGGSDIDAGLLLMAEVGFLDPCDARFVATVDRIGRELRHGNHVHRYAAADDFGTPATAFNICTFWYIDALARIGRREEAREMFESVLATRNPLGLMSEDVDPRTGERWGNYPQTYSMVGLINGAMRLSRRWDSVV
ncbi:GH15 family glucan-1,4-alpha-glucosidase [Tepidamorphus gemmatus]|uniref:GH15 family glucan-1,4-alpha-glucosidase n=1 Tax=Tepidamorphus gemmatus TaxID=747076 RepID=A0A4R3M5U2_9HYPH|nr:glycoside hydrolase family 15 protein [Tepidamorphus gemmatus]TCT08751.1 GH15 family glucan-1,4-alpha-glucosidase [Tepidamorphus gemmatus]